MVRRRRNCKREEVPMHRPFRQIGCLRRFDSGSMAKAAKAKSGMRIGTRIDTDPFQAEIANHIPKRFQHIDNKHISHDFAILEQN